jgi:hypothetical protein
MKKITSLLLTSVACAALLPACGPEGELPQGSAENTEVGSGLPVAPEEAQLGSTKSELSVSPFTFALGTLGGTGGVPQALNCPPGFVGVGITGRGDRYVDQLALICAYLNVDGSLGALYTTGYTGFWGGNPFTFTCPANQAIVGFHGRADVYLDRVGIHCANIVSWKTSPTVQFSSDEWGGWGGGAFDVTALVSSVVTSLNARGDRYVDQIQPIASYLVP